MYSSMHADHSRVRQVQIIAPTPGDGHTAQTRILVEWFRVCKVFAGFCSVSTLLLPPLLLLLPLLLLVLLLPKPYSRSQKVGTSLSSCP